MGIAQSIANETTFVHIVSLQEWLRGWGGEEGAYINPIKCKLEGL